MLWALQVCSVDLQRVEEWEGRGELNEANSTIVVCETRRLPRSLPKRCFFSYQTDVGARRLRPVRNEMKWCPSHFTTFFIRDHWFHFPPNESRGTWCKTCVESFNMGLFWALYTTSHLRRRIYSQIGIWYKSNWSLNVTVVEIVRGNHM